MARFAADRSMAAPPGTRFIYSTGSSLVLSGIVARLVGPGAPHAAFLDERLFGPLGTFWASGHDGQYLDLCPAHDLVLVRLGRTDSARSPAVRGWRDELIGSFAGVACNGDRA